MKKLFFIVTAAIAASVCAYSQQAQSRQEGATDGKAAVAEAPAQSVEKPAEGVKEVADSARAGQEQAASAVPVPQDPQKANTDKIKLPEIAKKLTPEELEHIKEQKMRDRAALKEAYTIKDRIGHFVKSIVSKSDTLKQFVAKKVFGLYVAQYILVSVVLLVTLFFAKYLLGFLFKFLYKTSKRGESENFASLFFKKIKTPITTLVCVMGLYLAAMVIITQKGSLIILNRAAAVAFWATVFWLILNTFDVFFAFAETKLSKKSIAAASLINFLRKVVKTIVIVIALLSILDNMGANVNAILASLGIGGMALAFASQDTIANFFGSVSIIIDRPFIVGDWIKTLSYEGNVEVIGFRSTRVRTFDKTLVTIPNSILAKESVENFSRMPTRRVVDVIGLTYSTTAKQLEDIIPEIRTTILSVEGVDPFSVSARFDSFGASSLNIKIIYYTKKINYDFHTDVKSKVNFAIMKLIADRGLSFAFPSTSVYVESMPGSATEK